MTSMKNLAQYYVDLLVKLGILRFSILLALALAALAVLVQVGLTLVWDGSVDDMDVIRSVFFGLVITPWAVYFLSVVVDQLEESRQRLAKLVSKLKEMRERDKQLNAQLQQNIVKLNQEIEERIKAEQARNEVLIDLKKEVQERKKTQQELAERTALLRSFIDASPDLIYYRNANGEFSGCNRAMEELTGKTESQLVGLTPWQVYSKEIAQSIVTTDQQVFEQNKGLTYEQWLEYPDGRKSYFELRKLPFYNQDGAHLGLVGFGRDITERKRHEESLEKASRDKTVFISTISHELRTPLNGIVGLSRMLLDTQLTAEQRKHMQTINISAITLGHIFNDIIDMDKFDRRKLELFPSPLNFMELMTEIDSLSVLMAQQKGLNFVLEQLTPLPEMIEVDATRLRQVLWNVISNAMKFTQEGSVIMSVSAQQQDQQTQIFIEVEDTGIGIPEVELDKIFAMYYQVKSTHHNLHAVGTGIGLAVSRQIMNLMGGDIEVSSEEGFGSTFSLSFYAPLCENTQLLVQPTLDVARCLRIFMVEDIELNITVARALLEKLGHQVVAVMNGQAAIAQFEPEAYDLVFLDIQLPDMTGFEVAGYFREHYSQLPPLIALTANALKDKQEYLTQGMDDVLTKPLSVEALQRVLYQVVEAEPMMSDIVQLNEKSPQQELYQQLLDLPLLTDFIALVGNSVLAENIQLFSEMMPSYLAILESNGIAKDQAGIVSQAHKIKGAAGAIGLKRIQEVAQKAQSPELAAWWENIDDWIEEIKNTYAKDIHLLQTWLEQQTVK